MANKRTKWVDHVVEKPNTYKEINNGDGTITHQDASGEIIQQGTPISATNLNKIEEGLQHTSIAFDWLYTLVQAQAREIDTLKEQVATLSS